MCDEWGGGFCPVVIEFLSGHLAEGTEENNRKLQVRMTDALA
jgi:hypothetical protein